MPNRWRSGETDPGRCADKHELFQAEAVASGMHSLVKYKINAEILHGRVKQFFHGPGEAVNLVDKKNIPVFKLGKHTNQVAAFFQGRARCHHQLPPYFVGNNMGQGGFPQPRGAVKKHVIEYFTSLPRCLDTDFKGFNGLFLADVLAELLRAQGEDFRFAVHGKVFTVNDFTPEI